MHCPQCSSRVSTVVHGGLFKSSCTSCTWETLGTGSYSWPEMPRTQNFVVSVLPLQTQVPAAALRQLRVVSVLARQLPLQELEQQLSGQAPFQVGVFAEFRAQEVAQGLECAGFSVCLVGQDGG